MRSQFVLDDQTEALLNELATARAGNRSFVVREAIRLYADVEEWLDRVEDDIGLQQMMADSLADVESGRVTTTPNLLQQRGQQVKKDVVGTPARARREEKKAKSRAATQQARSRDG
ncbi:MAG: hypothetical protein WCC92_13685 [Candidatus Korobacteraceae bacterium]